MCVSVCACLCTVASSSSVSREVDAYLAERNKYREQNRQRAKKGSEREAETLKMLAAFQSKMERSRKLAEYVSAGVADDDAEESDKKETDDDNDDDDDNDGADNLSWLVHGLYVYFKMCNINICLLICCGSLNVSSRF